MNIFFINFRVKIILFTFSTVFIFTHCSRIKNPISSQEEDESINRALEIKTFVSDDSTTVCDYLIITDKELLEPALRLAGYRKTSQQDDVEFPGVITTESLDPNFKLEYSRVQHRTIRGVIADVTSNWKHKPKYIVLFADHQMKPRLFTGIPIPEPELSGDFFYADLDSNNLPDVILGRIPVSNKEEADDYVKKVIAFESKSIDKILTVTDDQWAGIRSDGIMFDKITDEIVSLLDNVSGSNIPISQYRLADFGMVDSLPLNDVQRNDAHLALLDSLNTVEKFVTYLGHAFSQGLTHERIFSVYDIGQLKTLDVWISFGCNSNNYLLEDSFAKQLIRRQHSGAVAFIGPSTPGYAGEGAQFIKLFYRVMFNREPHASLGEIYYRTFNKYHSSPRDTKFLYLGDPALKINR